MSQCFPKVYPILDASFIPAIGRAEFLRMLGGSLTDAGVTLLEYRNKTGADAELLADATILREGMPPGQVKLILDDRVDLIEQIGFDGVHVDAGDLAPAEARRLLGADRIVGTFGGSRALVPGVLQSGADYFSIGPVFPTRTKQTPTPPIGIDGIRLLRHEAGPGPVLVAIGGITLATAAQAVAAEPPWWLWLGRSFARTTRLRSFANGCLSWDDRPHGFEVSHSSIRKRSAVAEMVRPSFVLRAADVIGVLAGKMSRIHTLLRMTKTKGEQFGKNSPSDYPGYSTPLS